VEQIKILFLKNFEDFYTHRREWNRDIMQCASKNTRTIS
jgi:hypothetical protein